MANTEIFVQQSENEALLTVFDGQANMYKYEINGPVKIGRRNAANMPDIALASSIVSRDHGEILQTNGKYYYCDHGSMNGTWVNEQLVGNGGGTMICELHDGDVLSFDLIRDGEHHPERVLALFTTSLTKENKWKKAVLSEGITEIHVGREKGNLQLQSSAVSENHASFLRASGRWMLIDHQSTNGVSVNGKRINGPQYLQKMDTVRIAESFFVFWEDKLLFCQNAGNRKMHLTGNKSLNIHIAERSVMQNFKKVSLLQNIDLSVKDGEMVLILGGSGAGKTTFINAVMGYEKAQGTIVYDNVDVYEEYDRMKYEIGFVPQQDLLRGSDTVYDTLSNAAEMKLPRTMSAADREVRINSVLEELGLKRERETLVSKLSGGQRKRLSIAVEFIADPSLFFLDEPDSGLDDIMGRGLMENLRAIADKGKIIMVITHSPERAGDLFDKVIVLAKSTKDNCGHLAFYGSPKQALAFFGVDAYKGIVKKINRPDENGEGMADHFIEKFAAMQKKG